jgi:hypothetical protein
MNFVKYMASGDRLIKSAGLGRICQQSWTVWRGRYRVFRAQVDWTLTHKSHKATEQSTIEASIRLDGVILTVSLIRWSPNKWPSVCREIPVSAELMFWTSNKPAQWTFYISAFDCLSQGKRPRFEFGTSTEPNGGNSYILARSEAIRAVPGEGGLFYNAVSTWTISDGWQKGWWTENDLEWSDL